ncbi:MAG: helix-turn-helix domain-containing protein [Methylobacterium sp.]|uniref:helix-turn-helix domain-containing protein n=1 Tax=Methylobacterium sp. TaxID=409 RepID=UPI0025EB2E20|nr:helix-turn-helix transcriptional regulator [Methylobacterium sp.]MBX9930382.1 helix-turn-helix domain-containing protein [Methylobacterium sp.]
MAYEAGNPHRGSSLESFLIEDGILEEADNTSIKRVIAWQIREEMAKRKMTKTSMARLMDTSRAQLDRLLNPDDGNVTINTIERAATVIGRKLKLELS